MKKLFNYLIATAIMAFTFTSCEDVPSPFGEIIKPDNKEDVVIEPSGSGTEADPYNVAAVLEYISGLGADVQSTKDVYVKGVITEVKEVFTTQYGNAQFIMSDTEKAPNKFTFYRGLYFGGAKYSKDTDTNVKDGDVVVICGKVVNYKGNTPETVQGAAYVVSINGKGGSGGGGGGTTETLGTKDAPLTIDQALEKINALDDGKESTQDAYVKGKVVKVTTNQANFEKYGNLNYLISVDGTDNGKTITVYSGDGLNGDKFTGITDLAQGDEVIVFGKLYKYVKDGKVTPEIAKGNYLVSLVKGSGGGGGGGDTETLGTKDAPLTIDQALEKINALDDGKETDKNAYVKGKVIKVTTNQTNFEKYGNLNYLISEDGTDNGKTITVYSGDGLNGDKFTGITDLGQGDEVIVFGKLYKYVKNGNVTPEIAKGNYLVSLVKGSGGGGDTGNGYKPVATIANGNYVLGATVDSKVFVATPLDASKTYGYLGKAETTPSGVNIETDAANEFKFTAVDGGYTIQSADGRYLYMKGDYNSFNVDATAPSEGHVWTVTFGSDNTVSIKNVLTGKTIQYSTQYKSYGAYKDITNVLPVLYKK